MYNLNKENVEITTQSLKYLRWKTAFLPLNYAEQSNRIYYNLYWQVGYAERSFQVVEVRWHNVFTHTHIHLHKTHTVLFLPFFLYPFANSQSFLFSFNPHFMFYISFIVFIFFHSLPFSVFCLCLYLRFPLRFSFSAKFCISNVFPMLWLTITFSSI